MLEDWEVRFFELYTEFEPNPQAKDAAEELKRLAESRAWAFYDKSYIDACTNYAHYKSRATAQLSGPANPTNAAAGNATRNAHNPTLAALAKGLANLDIANPLKEAPSRAGSESDAGTEPSDSSSSSGVQIYTPKGSSETSSHCSNYFDQYPEFHPDPSNTLIENFKDLARLKKWAENGPKYLYERVCLYDMEFTALFKPNASKLDLWREVCRDLAVSPVPQSHALCKNEISRHFINIFDYVDWKLGTRKSNKQDINACRPLKTFKNAEQLSSYSYRHHKVFPRALAKRHPMLKVLLRGIAGTD